MIQKPKKIWGGSFPVSLEGQENWIASQIGDKSVLRCIVADKNDEETGLGTVILSDIDYKNGIAQIHIKMDKESGRGKGYGFDAIKTLTAYAFDELRLNCIYADVVEYNIPSQRLFEKVGYIKEGILRSRVFKCGRFINILSYSMLKDERTV